MIKVKEPALILGNGRSRLGIELPKHVYHTYGCNAIYRTMNVMHLVSVDVAMQHEIYCSGYSNNNICWFPGWKPNNNIEDYDNLFNYVDPSKVIENSPKTDRCCIAGVGDSYYVTWVDAEDCVTALPEANKSAGEIAIELAIKHGHTTLFLIGFDGKSNVYSGTKNYHIQDGPYEEWYDGHEEIYSKNTEVTFYRVNCKMKESILPNCIHIDTETFNGML